MAIGDRLRAEHSDGKFYGAEVIDLATSEERAAAPVKVHFVGYGCEDDVWLPLPMLRSKKLPKSVREQVAQEESDAQLDLSRFEVGLSLQVLSEGVYYRATIVQVSGGGQLC